MKRLLIPLLATIALPTAVNAFPFSDIVIKTDVGEKYIVKNKTIKLSLYETKNSLLEYSNKNFEIEKNPIEKVLNEYIDKEENSEELVEKCKSSSFSKSLYIADTCEAEFGDISHFQQMQSIKRANIKSIELKYLPERKVIKNEQEKDIYKIFRFKPIYQDLNNKKTVMNTEFVTCINPKLQQETLDFISKDEIQRKVLDFDIYEDIKSRICKKYAKFK